MAFLECPLLSLWYWSVYKNSSFLSIGVVQLLLLVWARFYNFFIKFLLVIQGWLYLAYRQIWLTRIFNSTMLFILPVTNKQFIWQFNMPMVTEERPILVNEKYLFFNDYVSRRWCSADTVQFLIIQLVLKNITCTSNKGNDRK